MQGGDLGGGRTVVGLPVAWRGADGVRFAILGVDFLQRGDLSLQRWAQQPMDHRPSSMEMRVDRFARSLIHAAPTTKSSRNAANGSVRHLYAEVVPMDGSLPPQDA